MKFVIIFGPPAVGKMTVAQELAKTCDFKVFHNHVSIDFVAPFLDGTPDRLPMIRKIRKQMITACAKNSINLIYTECWDLNSTQEKKQKDEYREIIEKNGGAVFYVELFADEDTRLIRGKHIHRLTQKPFKKVEEDQKIIREWHKQYKLNSDNDFPHTSEKYLKIDNSEISAAEAAQKIKQHFHF